MDENKKSAQEDSNMIIGKINMASKGILDMLEEAPFIEAVKAEVKDEVEKVLLAGGSYFLVSDVKSLQEIYQHTLDIYKSVSKRKEAITGALVI